MIMSAELLLELLKEKQDNTEKDARRQRASKKELMEKQGNDEEHGFFYELGHSEGFACGLGTAANLIKKYLLEQKK
jgi:hypothetical protein